MPTLTDIPKNRNEAVEWIDDLTEEDREELIAELINAYDDLGDPFGMNYLKRNRHRLSNEELIQYTRDVHNVKAFKDASINRTRGVWSWMISTWNKPATSNYNKLSP